MTEGWCMKCKAKRQMMDVKKTVSKNGRPMMRGHCAKCDTKMCLFVKS
jgi:hypothetical protein